MKELNVLKVIERLKNKVDLDLRCNAHFSISFHKAVCENSLLSDLDATLKLCKKYLRAK